jgi:hypothetical protein
MAISKAFTESFPSLELSRPSGRTTHSYPFLYPPRPKDFGFVFATREAIVLERGGLDSHQIIFQRDLLHSLPDRVEVDPEWQMYDEGVQT